MCYLERRRLGVYFLLIAVNAAVYWQVRDHAFLNFDDTTLLLENPHLTQGLTWAGLKWAFCDNFFSDPAINDYWSPIPSLTHMLDFQVYGFEPAGHHGTNLLIHIANALVLSHALKRLTRAEWTSAAIAIFFSVHPLNVETVAWVITRNVLLAAFFSILA